MTRRQTPRQRREGVWSCPGVTCWGSPAGGSWLPLQTPALLQVRPRPAQGRWAGSPRVGTAPRRAGLRLLPASTGEVRGRRSQLKVTHIAVPRPASAPPARRECLSASGEHSPSPHPGDHCVPAPARLAGRCLPWRPPGRLSNFGAPGFPLPALPGLGSLPLRGQAWRADLAPKAVSALRGPAAKGRGLAGLPAGTRGTEILISHLAGVAGKPAVSGAPDAAPLGPETPGPRIRDSPPGAGGRGGAGAGGSRRHSATGPRGSGGRWAAPPGSRGAVPVSARGPWAWPLSPSCVVPQVTVWRPGSVWDPRGVRGLPAVWRPTLGEPRLRGVAPRPPPAGLRSWRGPVGFWAPAAARRAPSQPRRKRPRPEGGPRAPPPPPPPPPPAPQPTA